MVEVQKIDSANSVIKAKIDNNLLEEKKKKIAKKIAKTAKIPGFRPGKVPKDILKKQFGKAIFGAKKGDVVTVESPKGSIEYKIISLDS